MVASNVHDALAQVRKLQELILEKKLFRGYSGTARIVSGAAALAGAAVLSSERVSPHPPTHLFGWGAVLAIGLVVNYAALAWWFLTDPEARRKPLMLKPAIDAVPALGVGAVLTLALASCGVYDLLPGMWMCLYGLAQVAYRQSLPRGIYFVGLCYIACGAFFLLEPGTAFTNPWPMGIIFFAGEIAGGIVLMVNEDARARSGARPGAADRGPGGAGE